MHIRHCERRMRQSLARSRLRCGTGHDTLVVMSQTWILVLLMPGVAAAAGPVAASNPTARPTQCAPARVGHELEGDAVPGYPLIAGLRTGMSPTDVKGIMPRLSADSRRQKLELFPGLVFPATPQFSRYGLQSVRLTGRSLDAPAKALTERFGRPVRIDGGMRVLENPRETLPAGQNSQFLFRRYSVEKWCDGPRFFILSKDEDTFTLTVAGPRTKR